MAQPSRVAIGIRDAPDGAGASMKFFFNHYFAFETNLAYGGFAFFKADGTSIYATGLLEYHLPLPAPAWRLYFGGGAHIGYWAGRENHRDEFIFGLEGTGGIEYIFSKARIGISLDIKPPINFLQEVEFFPHGVAGGSLRYYLSGRKSASARW